MLFAIILLIKSKHFHFNHKKLDNEKNNYERFCNATYNGSIHCTAQIANPILGASYYVNNAGQMYLRIKGNSTSNLATLYFWENTTPTATSPTWGSTVYTPTAGPLLDIDGISYDYLVQVDNGTITPFTDSGTNPLSGVYYYSDDPSTPPNGSNDIPLTPNFDIPAPIACSHVEDPNNSNNIRVTLYFDAVTSPVNNIIYLWHDDITGPPSAPVHNYHSYPGIGGVPNAYDGRYTEFVYTVPKTDITGYSPDLVYQFMYYNDASFGSFASSAPYKYAGYTWATPLNTGSEARPKYVVNSASYSGTAPSYTSASVHIIENGPNYMASYFGSGYNTATEVLDTYFPYNVSSTGVSNYSEVSAHSWSPAYTRYRNIGVPYLYKETRATYLTGPSAGMPATISPDPCIGIDFSARFEALDNVFVTTDAYSIVPNVTSPAVNFLWSGGTTFYNNESYPGDLLLPYPSGSTSTNITMNYYFDEYISFVKYNVQCIVQMQDFDVAAKHAQQTIVSQTTKAIDAVALSPNPASDVSDLTFTLGAEDNVKILLIDAIGRIVSTVVNDKMSAGNHNIEIATTNLSAGIYNVTIQTSKGLNTQRLNVLR